MLLSGSLQSLDPATRSNVTNAIKSLILLRFAPIIPLNVVVFLSAGSIVVRVSITTSTPFKSASSVLASLVGKSVSSTFVVESVSPVRTTFVNVLSSLIPPPSPLGSGGGGGSGTNETSSSASASTGAFTQTTIIALAVAGVVGMFLFIFIARACDADRINETTRLFGMVSERILGRGGAIPPSKGATGKAGEVHIHTAGTTGKAGENGVGSAASNGGPGDVIVYNTGLGGNANVDSDVQVLAVGLDVKVGGIITGEVSADSVVVSANTAAAGVAALAKEKEKQKRRGWSGAGGGGTATDGWSSGVSVIPMTKQKNIKSKKITGEREITSFENVVVDTKPNASVVAVQRKKELEVNFVSTSSGNVREGGSVSAGRNNGGDHVDSGGGGGGGSNSKKRKNEPPTRIGLLTWRKKKEVEIFEERDKKSQASMEEGIRVQVKEEEGKEEQAEIKGIVSENQIEDNINHYYEEKKLSLNIDDGVDRTEKKGKRNEVENEKHKGLAEVKHSRLTPLPERRGKKYNKEEERIRVQERRESFFPPIPPPVSFQE